MIQPGLRNSNTTQQHTSVIAARSNPDAEKRKTRLLLTLFLSKNLVLPSSLPSIFSPNGTLSFSSYQLSHHITIASHQPDSQVRYHEDLFSHHLHHHHHKTIIRRQYIYLPLPLSSSSYFIPIPFLLNPILPHPRERIALLRIKYLGTYPKPPNWPNHAPTHRFAFTRPRQPRLRHYPRVPIQRKNHITTDENLAKTIPPRRNQLDQRP